MGSLDPYGRVLGYSGIRISDPQPHGCVCPWDPIGNWGNQDPHAEVMGYSGLLYRRYGVRETPVPTLWVI